MVNLVDTQIVTKPRMWEGILLSTITKANGNVYAISLFVWTALCWFLCIVAAYNYVRLKAGNTNRES